MGVVMCRLRKYVYLIILAVSGVYVWLATTSHGRLTSVRSNVSSVVVPVDYRYHEVGDLRPKPDAISRQYPPWVASRLPPPLITEVRLPPPLFDDLHEPPAPAPIAKAAGSMSVANSMGLTPNPTFPAQNANATQRRKLASGERGVVPNSGTWQSKAFDTAR